VTTGIVGVQLELQKVFRDKDAVRPEPSDEELRQVDEAYGRAAAVIVDEAAKLPTLWQVARFLWLVIKDCRLALKEATTP